MFYLSDAAIILLFGFSLFLLSNTFPSSRRTYLENITLGMGLGLGVAGTLAALSGHFFNFASSINFIGYAVAPLLLIFSLLSAKRWSTLRSNLTDCTRALRAMSRTEVLLLAYLSLTLAFTFLLTLAPPNANDYDSLVYHLAAPQRYLMENRIVELPYDHHTYFPFVTEMLFALGLHWKGPVLAKLFHWLMLPLCCMTLFAIASRHFSRRAGLVAAALFATIPLVQIEATTAYVDLALCAFVLLAFMCFANWLETRDGYWLLWSGVFCGFTLGVKYTGALYFLWLLIWAIGVLIATKNARDTFANLRRPLAAFVGISILLGGGWYIRNIFWTGNPVFPFAYEIFGGEGWTLQMAKDYSRDQSMFGFGRRILDFLLAPFRLAWAPLNFGQPFWPFLNSQIQNGKTGAFEVLPQITQSFIGPPLLAFGLPLIFMRRKPQLIGFFLWTFSAFWVFWFLTSQQIRYLLPTLALLCLCCGWGVLRLIERGALMKWTCALALAAWFIFVPAHTLHRMRDVLPVVMGNAQPEQYLMRTFSAYDAQGWASQNTPSKAVFAIYGEPRNFYLKRKYFWADDPHNNLIDYSAIRTGEDLANALREQGATHVLWNTQPERSGGFGGPPPQVEDADSQGLLKLLYESRGYRVYEISGAARR